MSFSYEVKEELSKINNLANKKLVKAELLGYLMSNNMNQIKNKYKFSTENSYNINRLNKLLSNTNVNFQIEIQGKVYTIKFSECENLPVKENIKNYGEEEKKAYVRGIFLGSGMINDPNKNYHLEIIFSNPDNIKLAIDILQEFGIETKILESKERFSLYTKDGEEISKILAFIGANKSVLKYEEIRVIREMKNNVNRIVNCETANLNKTINASMRQIEEINFLKEKGKYENLPEHLKEIAEVRLEHPELSIGELGNLLQKPIGKSGVSYRLQAISKYVEEIKSEEK